MKNYIRELLDRVNKIPEKELVHEYKIILTEDEISTLLKKAVKKYSRHGILSDERSVQRENTIKNLIVEVIDDRFRAWELPSRQNKRIKKLFYFELFDHQDDETFGVMVINRELTEDEYNTLERIVKEFTDKYDTWEYDVIISIVEEQLSKWGVNIPTKAKKALVI